MSKDNIFFFLTLFTRVSNKSGNTKQHILEES